MSAQEKQVSVLMVCMGLTVYSNICRSPMAEAVLKHQIAQQTYLKGKLNVVVDSAGTGAYHEGEAADDRTIAVCSKHGISVDSVARKIVASDYDKFDYILAMDRDNLANLQRRKPPSSQAKLALFGEYEPELRGKPQEIGDPYYGGSSGFEKAFQQCSSYSTGFLRHLNDTLR